MYLSRVMRYAMRFFCFRNTLRSRTRSAVDRPDSVARLVDVVDVEDRSLIVTQCTVTVTNARVRIHTCVCIRAYTIRVVAPSQWLPKPRFRPKTKN